MQRNDPFLLTGPARTTAITMGVGVAIDAALGIGAIVAVPFRRHNAVVPGHGAALYLAHALLGVILTAAALVLVARWSSGPRGARLSAITGAIGIGVAGVGGALATLQATRLVGMALMLLGWVVAETGYLAPAFDREPSAPDAFPGDPRGPA